MSIAVVATLKAKDDTYDTLVQTMKAILPDTAARDGAELVSCAADPDDKTIILYQIWQERPSQEAYMAWRGERGELEALDRMLREPAVFLPMEHVY